MTLRELIKNTPALVSLLVTASIVISAGREWVYFMTIDKELISLVSPTDYIRLAIHWLPSLFIVIASATFFQLLIARLEGFRSEDELLEGSVNPERTRFLRVLPHFVFLIVLFIGAIASLIYSKPTGTKLVIISACIWFVLFVWVARHPRIFPKLTRTTRSILFWGPAFVFWVIGHGYDDARRDLTVPSGNYRIVHKSGHVEENIHLLRAVSEGVIVLRVAKGEISFLTYPSFLRIDRAKHSQSNNK